MKYELNEKQVGLINAVMSDYFGDLEGILYHTDDPSQIMKMKALNLNIDQVKERHEICMSVFDVLDNLNNKTN